MVLDRTSTKAAWALIGIFFAERMEVSEKDDTSWGTESTSIFGAIQKQYRDGFTTEAQRDLMREHVTQWLGDPEMYDGTEASDYATYSCGMWAPAVGPMGDDEHAIILMTVQILEEEAA